MSENKLKGYIVQGCTGYYFSDEPSSYSCEYCGSHFTMGEIDGMKSLIDYSIGETFSSWLDVEGKTIQQVKNELEGSFDEDAWYFVNNFEHNMTIVLDSYHIKADELLKLAMDYVDRVYDEASGGDEN